MAARKLQTEIDRTLKKVSEGVELFESIYDKMQASTNQTQKEKLELDLKTQIKKLQRLRDQIKTWVASNDIKDKSALLENRKLIETQMEKFKACEKEMKTKAFSKEGLIQAAKLDPKEQEKEEAMQWLQTQVEELQMQVEQTEAEIEGLQGSGKKRNKGSSNAGRAEELEHLNERRKWHIGRLELVLRLLNNGSLSTEQVHSLKDDVSYFVESNTDEDFDEDEGIYDDLNLDEEEEKFGIANDDDESDDSDEASEDVPTRTPSKKHDEESVASSKRDDSPILKKATLRKHSVDGKQRTDRHPAPTPLTSTLSSAAKPPPNFSQQPMASVVKAGLSQPVRPSQVALPPVRYATAAAAAVAPHTPAQSSSTSYTTLSAASQAIATVPTPPNLQSVLSTAPSLSASSITTSVPHDQISAVTSSPSLTHPSATSPMLSSATSASQQHDGSFYSDNESPALSEAMGTKGTFTSPQKVTAKASPRPVAQSPQVTPPTETTQVPSQATNGDNQPLQSQQQVPMPAGPSPLPQQLQQYSNTPALKSPLVSGASSSQQPLFPPGVKVAQSEQLSSQVQQTQAIGGQRSPSTAPQTTQQTQRPSGAFPGSLSDLVVSFENVKQKALRMNNLDQVHKMLEGGYSNIPQPQDTEKPKYYIPRNPFPTPAYYPQALIPSLGTPAIFSQLDIETLFWVFYYLPGTYQQYLAAKELKRQSWRFHVKYLTWFQRHSEPQAITEDYEQGVYVYFDWEGSWCQRKKSDFRFEYRYLSEE
ncbi:Not1 N-terminal domain, CCR4-Not complex component-domain-containing protein [Cyathus striatus]|nr:Not1 N-terminal domain, CCR4-Not complex component-domain-containing protein [Cyathus striatus]